MRAFAVAEEDASEAAEVDEGEFEEGEERREESF